MFSGTSTPSVQFLFELPNSIKSLHSNNRLLFYGLILFTCGLISIINGSVATAYSATKQFYLANYVNTHWITSVFLLTGLATILAEKLTINYFLFASVCLNAISMCVAFGGFIFGCTNLDEVRSLVDSGKMGPYKKRGQAYVIYGVIDLITCLVAFVVSGACLLEIKRVSGRFFSSLPELKSLRSLLPCGVLLCIVGQLKLILWVCEVVWTRRIGEIKQFIWLNYTMDEPVWNLIFTLTGLFCVFICVTGSRVLAYCTLILTAMTSFPVMLYLWIDYRWLMNVPKKATFLIEVPKPTTLLQLNIAISIIHLILILVTCVVLLSQFEKSALPWNTSKVVIEASLKQNLMFVGSLLFAAGFAFLFTDMINIVAGTFFRIFHPTEQKLPFFLIPAGVLCLIILRHNEFLPYAAPCLIALLMLCCQATVFHIVVYLYLCYNTYFNDRLCELYFHGNFKCDTFVDIVGSLAHFFEAAMAIVVLVISLYTLYVFCRLCCLYVIPLQYPMTENETKKKVSHERGVKILAIGQLCLGVAVFFASIYRSGHENYDYSQHPIAVIHTAIHRPTSSLLYLMYPTLQLSLTSDLHIKPMKTMTLVILSCLWMTDILTQLDYRQLNFVGVIWTVLTIADLATLLIQFALMAECAILFDMGQNRLPQFDFNDYRPGLGSGHVTDGEVHYGISSSGLEFNSTSFEEQNEIDGDGRVVVDDEDSDIYFEPQEIA